MFQQQQLIFAGIDANLLIIQQSLDSAYNVIKRLDTKTNDLADRVMAQEVMGLHMARHLDALFAAQQQLSARYEHDHSGSTGHEADKRQK
jgi:hypothetical protein